MKVNSVAAFKEVFNRLFKKYHPDNSETGDIELFRKYHEAYEEALRKGLLDFLPDEVLDITLNQAFSGTVIEYDGQKLVIPKRFYASGRNILFVYKGREHKVRIRVVPNDSSEHIMYNASGDIELTKTLTMTVFDAILGTEKVLDIFGESVILRYKPMELFQKSARVLSGKGFWRKGSENRGDLVIRTVIKNVNLTSEDKRLLEEMARKYGGNG